MKKAEQVRLFMDGFTKSREEFHLIDSEINANEWFHEELTDDELLALVSEANFDLD